jgi:hypothetical protein
VRGASESRTYPLVAGVIRHETGLYTLPTLFSEYINDLAENINELACVVKFNEETTSILLYADDIALITPDDQGLQLTLNTLTDWCSKWKCSVNPEKTKVIHFRPQSFSLTDFQFKCANHDILKVNSCKYLGIWLEKHLIFDKSTKELAKSASRALQAVYGKFISPGCMSHKMYSKLYSSMVEAVLMYGSEIWGTKSYHVINYVDNKACLSVGRKNFENFNTRRYGLVFMCQ